MLIPAEIISAVYPVLEIEKDNLKSILTGKPIYKKDFKKKENFKIGEIFCVFCDGKFIGMYKITNDSNIFARSLFVMQPIKK